MPPARGEGLSRDPNVGGLLEFLKAGGPGFGSPQE